MLSTDCTLAWLARREKLIHVSRTRGRSQKDKHKRMEEWRLPHKRILPNNYEKGFEKLYELLFPGAQSTFTLRCPEKELSRTLLCMDRFLDICRGGWSVDSSSEKYQLESCRCQSRSIFTPRKSKLLSSCLILKAGQWDDCASTEAKKTREIKHC